MNQESDLQRRWRRVAAKLNANRATPRRLQALAATLAALPNTGINHADCLAELPAFVLAELAGEDVATLYAPVQQHLEWCADCSAEYALLLESAGETVEGTTQRQTESGTIGLDLGFLPPLSVAAYVQGVAESLWEEHFPNVAGAWETLADSFFRRMAQTPRRVLLETPPPYTPPTPDLETLLRLTYLATLRLLESSDPALWADTPRLRAAATDLAAAEATRHGLDPDNRRRFIEGFTAQVIATATALARVR